MSKNNFWAYLSEYEGTFLRVCCCWWWWCWLSTRGRVRGAGATSGGAAAGAVPKEGVDLLKAFRRVDAATVCLLFGEANGRSDAQNDAALQILTQLLGYAQRCGRLQALLDARPDKVNGLVHVAAGLGNWKALQLLRDFGADLSARNAAEHSAVRVVELNAFQARSLQFCEPPRAQADAGRSRGRNGRKRHKKQEEEEEKEDEETQDQDQELQSEAGELLLKSFTLAGASADLRWLRWVVQTITRSRPDRAVEAFHVTRTVLELTNEPWL